MALAKTRMGEPLYPSGSTPPGSQSRMPVECLRRPAPHSPPPSPPKGRRIPRAGAYLCQRARNLAAPPSSPCPQGAGPMPHPPYWARPPSRQWCLALSHLLSYGLFALSLQPGPTGPGGTLSFIPLPIPGRIPTTPGLIPDFGGIFRDSAGHRHSCARIFPKSRSPSPRPPGEGRG